MAEEGRDLDRNTIALTSGGKTTRLLRVGDIIGENYRIKGLLGRGGMGYVFRAEHNIIGKDYALKILAPDQINEITWNRFQSEGKAIARLDHPNIVKIYNMGIEGNEFPYYVMDILEGMALSDCIADNVSLSVDEILDIFIQLASGFGYAHRQGIIHRDVKPSNVMLIDSGSRYAKAKIVDFGIAKVGNSKELNTQSLTATGEVFGSPYYMSPEQCLGTEIDHRADIYSLGCTLFEALCGHPPFVGQTAVQTVMMHTNTPSPSLESVGGKFSSEEMEALVAKMLMKRPADRYQSMDQVRHDLERIRENKAVGKNVETGFKSSVDTQMEEIGSHYEEEQANRRKVKKVLIAAIASLVVFIGAVCLYLNSQGNKPVPRTPAATIRTEIKSLDLVEGEGLDQSKMLEAKRKIRALTAITSSIDKSDGMRVFHCPDLHLGHFIWDKGFKDIAGVDFDNTDDGKVDACGEARVPANEPVYLEIDSGVNREAFFSPVVLTKFGAAELTGLKLQTVMPAENISTDKELSIINQYTTMLMESLSGWTNLQYFAILNLPAPDRGLIALDKHKELRIFSAFHSQLDMNVLAKRPFLQHLSAISLGPEINCDPVLCALKGSKAIKSIYLDRAGVSAAGLSSLASCPNLVVLRLERCPIDTKALETIATIHSLRRLKIGEAGLTPDQIPVLAKFRPIEKVDLFMGGWPKAKFRELRELLPNCARIWPLREAKEPLE